MHAGNTVLPKAEISKEQNIDLVAKWMMNAWGQIPSEKIVKTFLKCFISNVLIGTKDDDI